MHPEATSVLPYLMIIAAYLLGSLSTAIVTCRLMGLEDPRTTGSKNPGATNVLRIGGKKAAIITLIGDMLKGLLPVLLAKWLGFDASWQALVGFAAFIGHLYPVYYGFAGGKGVATAIGVYTGLSLTGGLLVAATWLFIAKVLKISSLAALITTLLTPLYFYLLTGELALTGVLLVMTLLIFWRHKQNIKNILEGRESKIKLSKAE